MVRFVRDAARLHNCVKSSVIHSHENLSNTSVNCHVRTEYMTRCGMICCGTSMMLVYMLEVKRAALFL